MKAWIVWCQDEWCALVHADTNGKAKSLVRNFYDTDYAFTDFTAKRFPEMDNKKFTYQACKDADFQYLDDSFGVPIAPEEFINDCQCNICKGIIAPMKTKQITITVKDDAKQSEIDALIQCITILTVSLKLDAVIIYDEPEIKDEK